jgi:N-ATPase, AtpR subunit
MTNISPAELALPIACGALAGLALGLVYFALLRHTVADYLRAASLWRGVALTAVRFAAAAAVFWLLVHWSAAAAFAGLVGFTLARFTLGPDPELD